MNNVTLVGNVGKDPEVTFVGEKNTAICKLSLATNRRFKGKDGQKVSDWHRLVFWGKTAELVGEYVKKGAKIGVVGTIEYGKYTNKDGNDVYTTDINCSEYHMINPPRDGKPPDDENLPF